MTVPAITYVAALFSDAHVVTRSHNDEDEADVAAALIDTGSADMLDLKCLQAIRRD